MSFLSQPLQNILIRPKRKIGDINVQVILNESANDTLTITKQPVQQGASITDHAYKEPTTLGMTMLYSAQQTSLIPFGGSSLADLYKKFLDLQVSREPFDIVTPKRIYHNMLMATLIQNTDKQTENCLSIVATFQEVIIVSISTTSVPRSKQKLPAVTAATEKAGNKSALLSLKEGISALVGTVKP